METLQQELARVTEENQTQLDETSSQRIHESEIFEFKRE